MVKKTVLWILVLLWASVIFSFSAQPKEKSNSISTQVTQKIIYFISNVVKINLPVSSAGENAMTKIITDLNHYIRKSAHFTIYLILGILVILLILSYNTKLRTALIVALIICLIYAVSDEFHQLFVPGRGCQIKDMIIDFCGSSLGCLATFLLKLFKKA